jgi:threonine aldolase
MRVVDLRSDTVTKPTPQMREAMAKAEVGDDVFGEDPTVNLLQERVATLCGAEKALYVPSGSMGNLVSLRSMAQPGDEVICHEGAHFLHYEVGAISAVAGVQTRPLPGPRGVLDPDEVVRAIRPPGYTFPRTSVIAIENTHNLAGGAVYPIDDIRALGKIADEHELALYLDGARIFNASVATGIPVAEYFSQVDAMSFCFSKGLGAPVGSIVVGRYEFVTRAHRFRKMHGGGMRQVGVLAAAALVALDTMVERLSEDHRNARRLAEGIASLRPGAVDPEEVETNMVLVKAEPLGFTPQGLVGELAKRGVKFLPYGGGVVRMVTHNDVSSEDIEYVLEQLAEVAR